MTSSIDNGGSGALVVFLDHFWTTVVHAPELSSIDNGGSGPLGPGAFFTLLRALSPLLQPIFILWGARGVLAHLLFFGLFWGGWTICWSILAQQGEPLAWEPRFCTRGDSDALGPFFWFIWRNRGSLWPGSFFYS